MSLTSSLFSTAYSLKNAIYLIILFLKALYGVYAKDVHVRMACLNAVKCIPSVSGRALPQNVEVATNIWIALHDPEKVWLKAACMKI